MRLLLFRSLWTNGFDLDAALADCQTPAFDGVEGPVPDTTDAACDFAAKLQDAGVPFIAEITTGGGYVPERGATMREHLDSFQRKLDASARCAPLFSTVLAGCDAWPFAQSVEFFGRAMEIAKDAGAEASFETHRSRALFNPWTTRELLNQLPALQLTCDFSHWCCVCERLVMDDEPDLLSLFAGRARHIHARVGYAQGPQVPHPAAPEYRHETEAHERWWKAIFDVREKNGCEIATMTPEFGPDGYLQTAPFSGQPFANLDEINRWMALLQRGHFANRITSHAAATAGSTK